MKVRTQLVLLAIVLLVALAGGYAIGAKIERDSAAKSFTELLSSKEKLYEEVEIVRNKSSTLEKSIRQLSDKNTELLDLVAQLQARPEKIRYITITETVIEPSKPVLETVDLPSEHVFLLDDRLAVARFAYDPEVEKPYTFETYGLTFRNSVIISEKTTSGLLQISSTADPDSFMEFPIDSLEVRSINEQPLFEPHIGVGLTFSAMEQPDLLGSVFLSFLHPHENVDVLGIRIGANGQTAQLGIDAVGYNIAAHVPVITDLWIHVGVAIDIHAQPSGHLSLGTKF